MTDELRKRLLRSLQSGNINLLIGSGASLPAIPAAGQIESEIAELISSDQVEDAYTKMYAFLETVHKPTNALIAGEENANNASTLKCYETLLTTLEEILFSRRTNILPRQATVFSTNYDLFVEAASAACPSTVLNDGFSRPPSLSSRMEYSSRNFFKATYSTGNLYEYRVEVPSINLIKLHGSLSWVKNKDDIQLRVEERTLLTVDATHDDRAKFITESAVVLPQAAKFRETLLDRNYYDLLRIYANSLDRENTLLIVFGFSFGDEHIRDITVRALKNPTLRLMIFAFNSAAGARFLKMFEQHSNVEVVCPEEENELRFHEFNDVMRRILSSDME